MKKNRFHFTYNVPKTVIIDEDNLQKALIRFNAQTGMNASDLVNIEISGVPPEDNDQ